jgi:ribulose-5-phosphate 4-epimerase/fuculose-1-phosphate aldolase
MVNTLVTRRGFLAGGSMTLFLMSELRPGLQAETSQQSGKSAAISSAGAPDPKLVDDLVAANHILADQGIVDGYGHVSARHNLHPDRYLLSRSLAPELVTAADIMEFDLESTPVDPRGRALYVERFIHGQIYKTRRDVQAIVHHHSPAVIPFGVTDVPLQPIYHMAAFIGQGVPVFDIRKTGGMTDMLVRNSDLANALAKTLGQKPAALMRGHGAVVVGASLAVAVGRSVYLDWNAKLQAQAMAMGTHIEYLSPEEAEKAEPLDGYQRAWEVWRKKAANR